MKKYYEINPDSPYFKFMQNTENEQRLSEEEKQNKYNFIMNGFSIWGLEGFEYSEDEKNYLIYAFLNSIPDEEMEKVFIGTDKELSEYFKNKEKEKMIIKI